MQQVLSEWTAQLSSLNSYFLAFVCVVAVSAIIFTAVRGFFIDQSRTTSEVLLRIGLILMLLVIAVLADTIVAGVM